MFGRNGQLFSSRESSGLLWLASSISPALQEGEGKLAPLRRPPSPCQY